MTRAQEPEAEAPLSEVPWRRVHPATPYVRGWLAIVVVVFAAGRQWFDGIFTPDGLSDISRVLPCIVGASIGVLALVVVLFYVSWRFTSFRVTDTHVQLRTGVVSRKRSDARLDRVQAVDIGRPLLARLLGLSELRFEVADGGNTAFRLQYLSATAAEELRAEILRRAAGARADGPAVGAGSPAVAGGPSAAGRPGQPGIELTTAPGTEAPHEHQTGPGVVGQGSPPDASVPRAHEPAPGVVGPESKERQRAAQRAGEWVQRTTADLAGHDPHGYRPGGTEDEALLVQVPPERILGASALRLAPWALGVAVVLIAAAKWLDNGVLLGLAVPGVAVVAGRFWSDFNGGYGFRAAVAPDGLRLRHGLTDSQHRTVPPGRVQAVLIERPLFFRPFGWVRMEANIAGYGAQAEGKGEARSVLLPVGSLKEAATILATLMPDPGVEDPWGTLQRGLDGRGPEEFVTTPRRAFWLAPLAWRRQGFLVTRTALLLRTGRLGRRLVLVPHARTQGMRAVQGWLARLAGVASVRVSTTAGPVNTSIPLVAADAASELISTQVLRAAAAARQEDRNRWLLPAPGTVHEGGEA